jgi:hypothetical protein
MRLHGLVFRHKNDFTSMNIVPGIKRNQGEFYWTQNICEPELRHSKRGREDGKGKGGAARCLMRYRFSSLLLPRLTGRQSEYFVTVNEARRWLATSIDFQLD